jgi:hypothetical protein
MKSARHLAGSLGAGMLVVALLAILASGCGSSDRNSSGEESTTKTAAPPGAAALACAGAPAGARALRTSGAGCATGREVVAGWTAKNACRANAGASRTSCTVAGYRCLGIATEHELAISCARPGHSVSFLAKRR